MTTDTSQWRHAYMAELERCAMSLPSDRRAELLDQIGTHLDTELVGVTDDDQARAVLDRLGDPTDVVAEAAADLQHPTRAPAPAPAPRGPSAGEIVALLLMSIGGIALPLIAPAAGVMIMRATPARWTRDQVRNTWLILAVGLGALIIGFVMATVPNPPAWAGLVALGLIGVIMLVGLAAALYAASRPRPTEA